MGGGAGTRRRRGGVVLRDKEKLSWNAMKEAIAARFCYGRLSSCWRLVDRIPEIKWEAWAQIGRLDLYLSDMRPVKMGLA